MYEQVVIDPPWPQRKGGRRAVRPHQGRALDYRTLPLSELFGMIERNILPLARPTATIWLWTIDKFLLDAETWLRGLGYRLHARLIWDKGNGVAPAFTVRYSHEYLLWVYRPPMQPVAATARGRYLTVFHAKPREHSRKPDEAYALIDTLYPAGRRLDVFSREARPGWEQWGDQCHYFGASEAVQRVLA